MNDFVLKKIEDIFWLKHYKFQKEERNLYIKNVANIILIEKGDNPRNLGEVGLEPGVEGLLGEYPKNVCLYSRGDVNIFHITLLKRGKEIDLLTIKGTLEEDIEIFLENQLILHKEI